MWWYTLLSWMWPPNLNIEIQACFGNQIWYERQTYLAFLPLALFFLRLRRFQGSGDQVFTWHFSPLPVSIPVAMPCLSDCCPSPSKTRVLSECELCSWDPALSQQVAVKASLPSITSLNTHSEWATPSSGEITCNDIQKKIQLKVKEVLKKRIKGGGGRGLVP